MKIQSSLQTSGEGVSRLEKCPHDAHAQQTITHKQLRSSDKLQGIMKAATALGRRHASQSSHDQRVTLQVSLLIVGGG